MKKFILFLVPAFLINDAAEIVNQILVKKSSSGFFHTSLVYIVFLCILFIVKKVFNKIIKNVFWNALIWYILLGIFGLFIEWNLLGNAGAQIHGQIAMFTFWGSFGLLPIMFSEAPMNEELKKNFLRYLYVWIPFYVLLGIIVNPGFGLLIWILGTVWLNRYYFTYLKSLR